MTKLPIWIVLLMALSLLFPAQDPDPNLMRADFGASLLVSVVIAVAAIVLSELLRPKPNIEDARPAGLGDFNFPTATEGRPQPVFWGTCKFEGPNVVWYGDLEQVPIKETIKTGLWSKSSFIKGYRYNVGVQAALCRGRIDNLRKIWVGDKVVWEGTPIQDGVISINEPNLHGGDDHGQGGMIGDFRLYSGHGAQPLNTYLGTYQTPHTSAYRPTCYIVWEGGYVGNSTSIPPWKFELRRIPNGLALTGGKELVNSNDANCMNVIYEILTDPRWGFGFPASDINTAGFTTAAETLYSEGNGFSMIVTSAQDAGSLLQELERQIDGAIYLNQLTGKWDVTLARGGYTVGSLPQIVRADGDVLKVKNWDPGTWESLINEVYVDFNDRQRGYKTTYAKGSSAGQIRAQGQVDPTHLKFPGVKDATLAQQIADREIRERARPLGKCVLEVKREFWGLNPGDVFAWTDDEIGHTQLPMRVTDVDLGTLEEGTITVTAVQDIFSYSSGFNAPPPASGWTAPDFGVEEIPAARHVVFEAPYGIIRRDPVNTSLDRLWAGGRREDAPALSMNLYERNSSGTPSGAYSLAGEASEFLLIGKLKTAMLEEDPNPSTTDIQLEADDDTYADLLAEFFSSNAADVGQNLTNLLLVGDEFFAPETVTGQTTYIDLETCHRGLLDTVPRDHAVNDKVYLVFVGGNLSDSLIPQTNNVHAQLRQVSRDDETTEGEAVQKSLTMANRARRPYPPVEMYVNTSRYPSAPSWDTTKTGGSTLDDKGFEIDFTRRDWEWFDEVEALGTDAGTLDSSFPSKHTTEYRAEIVDTSGPTSLVVTGWAAAANAFLSRTKILRATGGTKPTTVRVDVETRHDADGTTRTAQQELTFTYGPGTSTLDNDHNWGNIAFGVISGTWSAPQTGTYTFNIGTAMPSGAVQARINGGSWVTVIAAAAVTGTLPGVTAADTIEVQHLSNTGTATETFCESLAPSGTVNAHAIMVY
jgi:hypothetical protein